MWDKSSCHVPQPSKADTGEGKGNPHPGNSRCSNANKPSCPPPDLVFSLDLMTSPFSQPTPGVCPVSYSFWTPQRTSRTWDDRWITLALHYFGQLKWPDEVPPTDSGISLLEIMLDLCISFQVRPPINAALSKLRLPEVPVLPPKSPAKYVLLSRASCLTLPLDTLTASVHTFLLTFDFLYPRTLMTPYPRENLRSLANLCFSDVVPSLKATPILLSGSEAMRLLSQTLVPGIRVLKYPETVPRRPSFPLPPGFPSDF